ncbi:hypothetical protein JW968_00490 [Candidatus Woesearchaeota archaeon]|nr:hypothetical protein [Candidatus Woesearchaeota archaeon]
MDKLLEKLQENFALSDSQVVIIEVLRDKGLDAKDVCAKTGIPKGRIYDYLNGLITSGLIEKSPKRPFLYSVGNLNKRIINFMKHNIDRMVIAQADIIDQMRGPGAEHIDIVNNSKQFTQMHLQMIVESNSFRYMSLHQSFPYAFYPMDFKRFVKLRRAIVASRPTITHFDPQMTFLVHKTYNDALKRGKSIEAVLERSALDFHLDIIMKLGPKFFEHWKSSLLKNFERYKLKGFVLDDYIPMQIDVNDKRVNISLRHLGVTTGVVIVSKEVTKFYNTVISQNCNRAVDLRQAIENIEFVRRE